MLYKYSAITNNFLHRPEGAPHDMCLSFDAIKDILIRSKGRVWVKEFGDLRKKETWWNAMRTYINQAEQEVATEASVEPTAPVEDVVEFELATPEEQPAELTVEPVEPDVHDEIVLRLEAKIRFLENANRVKENELQNNYKEITRLHTENGVLNAEIINLRTELLNKPQLANAEEALVNRNREYQELEQKYQEAMSELASKGTEIHKLKVDLLEAYDEVERLSGTGDSDWEDQDDAEENQYVECCGGETFVTDDEGNVIDTWNPDGVLLPLAFHHETSNESPPTVQNYVDNPLVFMLAFVTTLFSIYTCIV